MGCGCSRAKKKVLAQTVEPAVTSEVKVIPPEERYKINGIKKVNYIDYQAEVDSWIGSRFWHMGRNKKGVDCINMVLAVYANLGLIKEHPKLPEYPLDWYNNRENHPVFDDLVKKYPVQRIEIGNFMPADFIVFKVGKAEMAHVGLYTIRDSVIHSVFRQGVIESRPDDPMWYKRIVYGFRLNYDK